MNDIGSQLLRLLGIDLESKPITKAVITVCYDCYGGPLTTVDLTMSIHPTEENQEPLEKIKSYELKEIKK